MIAKIISWLILVLFLASCYRTSPDTNFDMKLVIQQDSMVTLLSDLHTADGIIATLKANKKPIDHLSTEYFAVVLQKHAISRESFEESMRYYAFHTEELNEIYENVIINLSKQESMILSEEKTDTLSVSPLP